jgi:hypothetical protein
VKTTATVLASSDDAKRCLERVRLEILPEPESRSHVKRVASDAAVKRAAANLPWTFPTGTSIRIRLRLEHDHFLYGPYDPLLGRRKVHIEINNHSIIDEFDLFPDPVSRGAATPLAWPATDRSPPEDRLDQSVFRSPPDSLHLEAHLPGAGSYRFPDCPIPYGSRLRLRFWYLIATGSDGVGRVRLVQSSDAPSRWRILSAGECEQTLAQVGRWTKFEHTFRADLEATTLAVDFRLAGEFGEAWFDDITLDVLDEEHPGP